MQLAVLVRHPDFEDAPPTVAVVRIVEGWASVSIPDHPDGPDFYPLHVYSDYVQQPIRDALRVRGIVIHN